MNGEGEMQETSYARYNSCNGIQNNEGFQG